MSELFIPSASIYGLVQLTHFVFVVNKSVNIVVHILNLWEISLSSVHSCVVSVGLTVIKSCTKHINTL